MLDEYGPLVVLSIIILSGIFISSPLGKNLNMKLSETRRMLLGLIVIETGTLLTSMWTEVIHRELAATGFTNFCAAEGIVQCGSVIGHAEYSQFMGISWGMIGMISFSILLYLSISLFFGPRDKLAGIWLKGSFLMSLSGLLGVIYLVIIEVFVVKHLCPYCTVVHIGMIVTIAVLYILRNQHEEGIWDVSNN